MEGSWKNNKARQYIEPERKSEMTGTWQFPRLSASPNVPHCPPPITRQPIPTTDATQRDYTIRTTEGPPRYSASCVWSIFCEYGDDGIERSINMPHDARWFLPFLCDYHPRYYIIIKVYILLCTYMCMYLFTYYWP